MSQDEVNGQVWQLARRWDPQRSDSAMRFCDFQALSKALQMPSVHGTSL